MEQNTTLIANAEKKLYTPFFWIEDEFYFMTNHHSAAEHYGAKKKNT